MTLYLLKFNNYFNRKIIKYDSIEEYIYDSEGNNRMTSDAIVNFQYQPTDETSMKVTLNRKIEEIGNYFLVVDGQNIIARYFVIECKRNAYGQYDVFCRRDIISDFYDDVVNAPAYIEKATINNSNPLIFNKEDLNVNQIKQEEVLLKDETNSAWIVGYIARNYPETDKQITINSPENVADITQAEREANYKKYYTGFAFTQSSTTFCIGFRESTPHANQYVGSIFDKKGDFVQFKPNVANKYSDFGLKGLNNVAKAKSLVSDMKAVIGDINEQLCLAAGYISKSEFDNLLRASNKTVLIDNILYTIKLVKKRARTQTIDVVEGSRLANLLLNNLNTEGFDGTPTIDNIEPIESSYDVYQLQLVNVGKILTMTLPASRLHLYDAPYDMFVMPYSDTLVVEGEIGVDDYSFTCSKKMALAIAQEIGDNQSVYDIQVLPYCPLNSGYAMSGDNTLRVSGTNVNLIDDVTGNVSMVLFWCDRSSFQKDVIYSIQPEDYKIDNETKLYRLCSPNFNGAFDFSPSMNFGVDYFSIDCVYKPYQPYIHIAPNFKGMYGGDYDDARGLICQGNFSITRISDAWESYEMQNKNYQNTFNRQVQNMKVQQDYDRVNQAVSSIGSAAIMGIGAGISTANPFVGVAAGVASMGAGVVDMIMSENLRKEQLSYTKDMFNYSLENIQALPYTLSSVSPLTNNYKDFPFIEIYSCSEVELNAFKNKIRWNGMKINAIGTIAEYITYYEIYIKAQLIRLEGLYDYHISSEIREELNKGIFIGGEV